jgi:hypothetical protein
MKQITNSWTLPCTPEQYWDLYLDAEYSRALYVEALGFAAYQVLHSDETSRKLRLQPKLSLPGPLVKIVGDAFSYEQHATIDRKGGLWTWKMVQPGDKKGIVSSNGTIRISDAGAGQCVRRDEVFATGNIFGIGSLLESTVEKEVRATWDKEIAFFKRRIAAR